MTKDHQMNGARNTPPEAIRRALAPLSVRDVLDPLNAVHEPTPSPATGDNVTETGPGARAAGDGQ